MRLKFSLPKFQLLSTPTPTFFSPSSSSSCSFSTSSPTCTPSPITLPPSPPPILPPPSFRRPLITTPSGTATPSLTIASGFEGAQEPGLRMVLFGKPGSGKGTLSQKVLDTYPDVNLVSVGDVLRKEIAAKTEVGRHAESLVARGEFVPDEVMLQIALNALAPLHSSHWILDGFPRTLNQGMLLDQVLAKEGRALNLIVNLGVKDDTILRRIADRWIHVASGRVYNSTYNKPLTAGLDDVTNEPLAKRPDDTPEVFQKRLDLYNTETFPLLHYFGDNYPSLTHELSGETSDEIWPEMAVLLEGVLGKPTAPPPPTTTNE
ncbi:adenylate kinase-domain-containing protein [Mrakia frigida]|uniref:adenylate kinase family protein n=1 Tax=Mrakia frigida TaxID=29902 RepID=UPI003FCC1C97